MLCRDFVIWTESGEDRKRFYFVTQFSRRRPPNPETQHADGVWPSVTHF